MLFIIILKVVFFFYNLVLHKKKIFSLSSNVQVIDNTIGTKQTLIIKNLVRN